MPKYDKSACEGTSASEAEFDCDKVIRNVISDLKNSASQIEEEATRRQTRSMRGNKKEIEKARENKEVGVPNKIEAEEDMGRKKRMLTRSSMRSVGEEQQEAEEAQESGHLESEEEVRRRPKKLKEVERRGKSSTPSKRYVGEDESEEADEEVDQHLVMRSSRRTRLQKKTGPHKQMVSPQRKKRSEDGDYEEEEEEEEEAEEEPRRHKNKGSLKKKGTQRDKVCRKRNKRSEDREDEEEEEGEEEQEEEEEDSERRRQKKKPRLHVEVEKKAKTNATTSAKMTQRATLINFVKVESLVGPIPLAVWEKLHNTPFGNLVSLVSASVLQPREVEKSNSDLETLLRCYNKEDKVFVFGQKRMAIRVSDVAELLGMEARGETINLDAAARPQKKEDRYPTIRKYFKGISQLSPVAARGALKIGISKHNSLLSTSTTRRQEIDELEDELAQLVLIHLCSSFLFPSPDSFLRWDIAQLCTNLGSLPRYNWPQFILSFLESGLQTLTPNGYKIISGCVFLVLYVFYRKYNFNFIPQRENYEAQIARFNLNTSIFLRNVVTPEAVEQKILAQKYSAESDEESTENDASWEPTCTYMQCLLSQQPPREHVSNLVDSLHKAVAEEPTLTLREAQPKIEQLTASKNVLVGVLDNLLDQIEERDEIIKKLRKVCESRRKIENVLPLAVYDPAVGTSQGPTEVEEELDDAGEQEKDEDKEEEKEDDNNDETDVVNDNSGKVAEKEGDKSVGKSEAMVKTIHPLGQGVHEEDVPEMNTPLPVDRDVMNVQVTLEPVPQSFVPSPQEEQHQNKGTWPTDLENTVALSLMALPTLSMEKAVKKRSSQAKEVEADFRSMETPEGSPAEKKTMEGKYEKLDKKKLPTNTPVWKKLKKLSKDRLNDWWYSPKRGKVFKYTSHSSLDEEDIVDLLQGHWMTNTAIDAYTDLLMLAVKEKKEFSHVQILRTEHMSWTGNENFAGFYQYFAEIVVKLLGQKSFFIMPILHNTRQHFTLLTMDTSKRFFNHYDPKEFIEQVTPVTQQCIKRMCNKIEQWLYDLQLDARKSFRLYSLRGNKVMRLKFNDEKGRLESVEATEEFLPGLNWIAEQKDLATFKLTHVEHMPMQRNGNDCGPYILCYIDKLAFGENPVKKHNPQASHQRSYVLDKFAAFDDSRFLPTVDRPLSPTALF